MKFLLILLLSSCCTLYSSDIMMVTMAVDNDYKDVVMPSIKNKKKYCKRHHYDFSCTTKCLDKSRPASWSKILCLLDGMEDHSIKWLFWSNAESLIMNMTVHLESFIDDDYDIIISNNLDTSQFFIKNSEWSRNFLKNLYLRTEFNDPTWWDNMSTLIKKIIEDKEVQKHVKQVPSSEFNAYSVETIYDTAEYIFNMGDFIVNFSGQKGENLKLLFKKYSNFVID